MQSELQHQNALIKDTLDELKGLYAAINSDLIEAQKLQQSLIREHERQISPFHITQFVKSSGHVGGDLIGFFLRQGHRSWVFLVSMCLAMGSVRLSSLHGLQGISALALLNKTLRLKLVRMAFHLRAHPRM